MTATLEINLVGRIMLGAPRHGISDPIQARRFARAIMAVIEHEYPNGGPGLIALEPLITEQLLLLEASLVNARLQQGTAAPCVIPTCEQAPVAETAVELEAEQEEPTSPRQRNLKGKGHTVVAKPMEEKLRDERAPVSQLLREECVSLGLIDQQQAEDLVGGMLGKSPQEGEQLAVERLRQILQEQVKGIIRRLKGGPWSSPMAQEAMRQDIHNARSVRSIIMLTRQVIKERRAWEKEHGMGGMFGGLFGSRKGLAR